MHILNNRTKFFSSLSQNQACTNFKYIKLRKILLFTDTEWTLTFLRALAGQWICPWWGTTCLLSIPNDLCNWDEPKMVWLSHQHPHQCLQDRTMFRTHFPCSANQPHAEYAFERINKNRTNFMSVEGPLYLLSALDPPSSDRCQSPAPDPSPPLRLYTLSDIHVLSLSTCRAVRLFNHGPNKEAWAICRWISFVLFNA